MKVIDYSNTIMYKIVPNDLNLDLIYIGNTTNFRARKSQHKCHCTNSKSDKYNLKVYSMIRENGGWSEWSMLEIEKYPCLDSNEACKRERELMEQYNANLNMRKSYISPNEVIELKKIYYTNNRTHMRNQQKDYYDANKITIQSKRLEKKLASLNLEN